MRDFCVVSDRTSVGFSGRSDYIIIITFLSLFDDFPRYEISWKTVRARLNSP